MNDIDELSQSMENMIVTSYSHNKIMEILNNDFYYLANHIIDYGYKKDLIIEGEYNDNINILIYNYLENHDYGYYILIEKIFNIDNKYNIDENMVIYYINYYISNLF